MHSHPRSLPEIPRSSPLELQLPNHPNSRCGGRQRSRRGILFVARASSRCAPLHRNRPGDLCGRRASSPIEIRPASRPGSRSLEVRVCSPPRFPGAGPPSNPSAFLPRSPAGSRRKDGDLRRSPPDNPVIDPLLSHPSCPPDNQLANRNGSPLHSRPRCLAAPPLCNPAASRLASLLDSRSDALRPSQLGCRPDNRVDSPCGAQLPNRLECPCDVLPLSTE